MCLGDNMHSLPHWRSKVTITSLEVKGLNIALPISGEYITPRPLNETLAPPENSTLGENCMASVGVRLHES